MTMPSVRTNAQRTVEQNAGKNPAKKSQRQREIKICLSGLDGQ
jgi:hypothetical protein